MLYHVVWYLGSSVTEECATSIIRVEDEDSTFLREVCEFQPDYDLCTQEYCYLHSHRHDEFKPSVLCSQEAVSGT